MLINLRLLKVLSTTVVLSAFSLFMYGCADVQVGNPDPEKSAQAYEDAEWRNSADWDNKRPQATPWISKTVVFTEKEDEEKAEGKK